MKPLEYLKQEKKELLQECIEMNTNQPALNQRIQTYQDALTLKDMKKRLKSLVFTISVYFLLTMSFTMTTHLINPELLPITKELLLGTLSISSLVGVLGVVKKYCKDRSLLGQKLKGKFYLDLSVEELREKIKSLEKEKEMEKDAYIQKRAILSYVEEKIHQLEKIEEEKILQGKKLIPPEKFDYQTYQEKMKQTYLEIPVILPERIKDIHLEIVDVPKVKVKRRDEHDTETKRNL